MPVVWLVYADHVVLRLGGKEVNGYDIHKDRGPILDSGVTCNYILLV